MDMQSELLFRCLQGQLLMLKGNLEWVSGFVDGDAKSCVNIESIKEVVAIRLREKFQVSELEIGDFVFSITVPIFYGDVYFFSLSSVDEASFHLRIWNGGNVLCLTAALRLGFANLPPLAILTS